MTNIVSKTLPVDSIRPDIRISLFLFNSEVYTLYEINIPAAHDNRRRNDKKVPRYSKFVDSVKFQAIKLTILIRKTIRAPDTTFLLLPSKYSIVFFMFLLKKGSSWKGNGLSSKLAGKGSFFFRLFYSQLNDKLYWFRYLTVLSYISFHML